MVCNAFFEFVCVARKMYFLFLTLDKLSRFYAHFVLRFIYKIAIPHWYDHKIQLLLPLVLTGNDNIPDLALVVDKDKNRNIYRGKTVLTLDQAYIDARIITSPDSDWLNP